MKASPLLVIGEYGIDKFVYGYCNRLAPEAPAPVINPVETIVNEGLASNTFANLCSLSPKSKVYHYRQETPIIKTRYVDKVHNYTLLRVDEDDQVTNIASNKGFDDFLTEINVLPSKFKAVIISDYNKGFLPYLFLEQTISLFKGHSIPVFLDTKKILGKWSQNAIVKINEKEYNLLSQQNAVGVEYYKDLIVTVGEKGAWWDKRPDMVFSRSQKIEVFNRSGAGDTFLAAFVLEYLRKNGNIIKAIDYANLAASIAVQHKGVVAVQEKELLKLTKK